MCMKSGGGSASEAARAQQQKQEYQIGLSTNRINQAFGGFTPEFYGKRAQAYEDYALPQLNQQLQGTQDNANFKLFNQGLEKSSQAQQLGEALGKESATQKQGVANEGIRQAQSLQQQVEQERQQLIGQANVATDPMTIAGSALNAAGQFAAPSTFAPIGQLFNNFANTYLAGQLNKTYSPYYGSQTPRIGTGLPTMQLNG